MTAPVPYGASPVKPRVRRTRAALEQVDRAIIAAVELESPVTLRGVYYRVVSAGAVEKTEDAYKLVTRQLLKLRRDGTISYADITDGSRLSFIPTAWDDVEDMLADAAVSYRRSLWQDQRDRVIILSEKDAISGVVHPVTDRYQVELGIVRGYSSETFTHSIAQTVLRNAGRGQGTFIYQLGDHDPSGVDAWRSFRERVTGFVGHFADHHVWFERLAVTPAQVTTYNLPTRPTKQSDTRARNFEGESVEVDALPPTVLRQLVQDAIERHIDPRALEMTELVERNERAGLRSLLAGGRP